MTVNRQALLKVLILGAPGSGKGTISNRIVRDFNLGYFCVGDVLRDNIKRSTKIGVEAQKFIKQGQLVPDNIINKLVIDELRQNFSEKIYLLDGYPRNKSQAAELWSYENVRPNSVLNLVVPDDEIIERIRHRWIHPGSSRIYHTIYNPPKKAGIDDVTGEALVQREDDKEDVVRARLEAFHKENSQIVKFFREKQILTDFFGRESDVIYPMVKAHLEGLISK